MKALEVSQFYEGVSARIMKIDGLSAEELDELNSMDYREMKEKILEMLDARNMGIGTVWACGYGVYSVFMNQQHPMSLFVEIGRGCD